MKKMFYAALAAVVMLAACGSPENNLTITPVDSTATKDTVPKVGGDKDAHGCIASAGYTWSVLKNTCVQTFAVANAKLLPVKDTLSYTSTANLIFNADTSKIELYLPKHDESIVLNRNGTDGNYSWKNDSLEITGGKTYTLKAKGVVIFQSK